MPKRCVPLLAYLRAASCSTVLLLGACAGLQDNAKTAQGQTVFASSTDAAPTSTQEANDATGSPLLQRTIGIFRLAPKANSAPDTARQQLQALASSPSAYRIGAGDVLDIDISNLGAPQPDSRAQIALDAEGVLDLGELGAYRLQGLTPTQAQRVLRTALETPARSPIVALRVDQYRSQFVRLLGQVYAPGDYYIDATPMSLAEAITRAGGLLDDADLSLIVLTRNGRTENLDLRQLYALGLQPQDLMLRHGDVLRFAPTE